MVVVVAGVLVVVAAVVAAVVLVAVGVVLTDVVAVVVAAVVVAVVGVVAKDVEVDGEVTAGVGDRRTSRGVGSVWQAASSATPDRPAAVNVRRVSAPTRAGGSRVSPSCDGSGKGEAPEAAGTA